MNGKIIKTDIYKNVFKSFFFRSKKCLALFQGVPRGREERKFHLV
jgi:hypothetical protein